MTAEEYMKEALNLAKCSARELEVPVGAIIVKDNKIIARGRNKREYTKNALSHAEIEAINNACKELGGWRLNDCDMYVTLEPCPMCAGAIVNSRIRKVYFGAFDKNNGCCGSIANILELQNSYHPQYEGGILIEDCQNLLTNFFTELRKKEGT